MMLLIIAELQSIALRNTAVLSWALGLVLFHWFVGRILRLTT